jgi:hypothetical protein
MHVDQACVSHTFSLFGPSATFSPYDTPKESSRCSVSLLAMESFAEEKRALQGKERFRITPLPVLKNEDNDMGRSYRARTGYLEGLRGLFTIFCFLLIFFRVFAPAIQTDTDDAGFIPAAFVEAAPAWQNTLRKIMAPIFWNSTLTPHFFIILSGRVGLQSECV